MPVLQRFRTRFAESGTEEGTVMATVLAYAISDSETSGRREILAEYRDSERIKQLFDSAVLQRTAEAVASGPDSPDVEDSTR